MEFNLTNTRIANHVMVTFCFSWMRNRLKRVLVVGKTDISIQTPFLGYDSQLGISYIHSVRLLTYSIPMVSEGYCNFKT